MGMVKIRRRQYAEGSGITDGDLAGGGSEMHDT
jgi:hypothetical protein